jgi:pimeloyl-ACP methyl ester carboxylesterase
MASPDRTAGLASVSVPTLVIHGLLDTLVKPSGGIATAAAVPAARLLMFPDMGHDLPTPRWSEMVEAIRQNADRAAVASPVS